MLFIVKLNIFRVDVFKNLLIVLRAEARKGGRLISADEGEIDIGAACQAHGARQSDYMTIEDKLAENT